MTRSRHDSGDSPRHGSDRDSDPAVSRETRGGQGDPRAIARDAAADATRVLVEVMSGYGGRNAVARVNAAMRVLELSGHLEEKPKAADDARTVVVAATEVARAAELLAAERRRKLADGE